MKVHLLAGGQRDLNEKGIVWVTWCGRRVPRERTRKRLCPAVDCAPCRAGFLRSQQTWQR